MELEFGRESLLYLLSKSLSGCRHIIERSTHIEGTKNLMAIFRLLLIAILNDLENDAIYTGVNIYLAFKALRGSS